MALEFRFDASCALQSSLDGGSTWTDVPGWDTFAPGCFTGAAGPAGAVGATGPAGPAGAPGADASNPLVRLDSGTCQLQVSYDSGTSWTNVTGWSALAGCLVPDAPNPRGDAIDQHACNIAGYLANEVIKQSIAQAVADYNSASSVITYMLNVMTLVPGVNIIARVAAIALYALYEVVTGTTISDFTDASTNATLWGNVTCAIYSAIRAAGDVTSANFAAILTNLAGVSYAHAEVVTAIHDYVNNLGADGLRALQAPGALASYDCSACSSAPTAPALAFGTSTGWVALGSDIPTSGNWTMGGWMDPVAISSSLQSIFIAGWDGGTHANQMHLYWLATSRYLSCYCDNGVGSWLDLQSATAVSGSKHLLAVRRSASTLTLWVDGVQVATGTLPSGSFASPSGAASGFGGLSPASRSLGVDMWRWAHWAYALTDAQMLTWYNAGSSGTAPAGADHIWLYDEASGTTIHDTVGTDHGTGFGDITWTTHT